MKKAFPKLELDKSQVEEKIIQTVHLKNIGQFQRLLRHVDPSFHRNYLLRLTAAKGMTDFVKILIDTGKVDASDWDYWPIVLAHENGHDDIVKVLMNTLVNKDKDAPSETGSLFILNDLVTMTQDTHVSSLVKFEALDDLKLFMESIGRKKLVNRLSFLLDQMVICRELKLVDPLLELGADPFILKGSFALLSAVKNDDFELFYKLLNYHHERKTIWQFLGNIIPIYKYIALIRAYPESTFSDGEEIKSQLIKSILNQKLYLDTLAFGIWIIISFLPLLSYFASDLRIFGRIIYLTVLMLNGLKRSDFDGVNSQFFLAAYCSLLTAICYEQLVSRAMV